MDIEALRCFLAVVETGSYTQASKQVHRSQSAVSHKMHKLAEQTGKTLFEQKGRTLVLTEDGKFLLGYARHILTLNDEALRRFQDHKAIVRPLQLGCPDDYAEVVLPQIVKQIQACVPNLPLHIHCTNSTLLHEMLASRRLDVAVVSGSASKPSGHPLMQSQGVWAFHGNSDALAEQFATLGSVPLVLFEQSCHFHLSAVQGLSLANVASHVVASTNSLSVIENLVLAGQGITVVGSCSVGRLTVLDDTNNPLPFALPKLPSVSIELVMSANPHPNFGREQVMRVVENYHLANDG